MTRFCLYVMTAVTIAALGTGDAAARAKPRGTNPQPAASPLETALKDLQAAEKELDGKTLTDAKAKVSAAQGIVDQQEKQAKGKGGDKDRASALDAVLKDIKAAAKDINARKTGDAK